MARKVILDVDPGIDDLAALCIALFDPRLDIVAVTAVSGSVPAAQATRNLLGIIEFLDPPKRPRIGAATEPEHTRPADLRHLYGPSGLGDATLEVADLHHKHSSAKVICEALRAEPGDITVLCLGPLTNLSAALRREPELASLTQALVVRGGAIDCGGDATPSAEFNIYCDPAAAREVFRAKFNVTLVPLDVTSRIDFSAEDISRVVNKFSRAGELLGKTLPYAFRAHHEHLGVESLHLNDAVGVIALSNSSLFESEEHAVDVETIGELTLGATVLDRRPARQWPLNLNVMTSAAIAGVRRELLDGMLRAGEKT
ncbi:MAG: nucleoside hydrolase [Pirellulales bacterium]|nr:nucleoside hydrolase [Pirellulales bacterium]